MKHRWSRRAILRHGAAVGAIAAVPAAALAQEQALLRSQYLTLSVMEAATLEAMVARLIPRDANGPGAREAGVVNYIDRALRESLAIHRQAYSDGLARLDRYAVEAAETSFHLLVPERQDELLTNVEQNRATGFTPSSSAFFDLVLGHTLEGMFGDPHYGGNRDFIGWELIGYPGLRLAVTEEQQRMNAAPEPIFTSAYDHAQFTAHDTAGERDGD
jgi:gluconate 2-dehydrogenase gamma chain